MNIVWFKRDLRIEDHEPLVRAAGNDAVVLPLYILEPALWAQPDMSHRHYSFLVDCINELDLSLKKLGQKLIIKVGDVINVLEKIQHDHKIDTLWSHQETWNGWTYKRDKAVKKWCEENNITWCEPTQNGVVRSLSDRNGWSTNWYNLMNRNTFNPPKSFKSIKINSDTLPKPIELGLIENYSVSLQKGGRIEALRLLNSFLYERGANYSKEMSSPVTAFDSCSRLSTYLSFGVISIREVFQACENRNKEITEAPKHIKGNWPSTLRAFSGRLRWHCHFIQKLEDEPNIEFKNMHPAYDTIRTGEFNEKYFLAWKSGNTGYPMVDACMRALHFTGWLNFRMRAMILSFASYNLWLHWRKPAIYLAKLFTDYEPGIHYSQIQMQSGTTGINTIRIYNPIKQSIDQDPNATFIRFWVPELYNMEKQFIYKPWEKKSQMNNYPMPIVDEKISRKTAADKLYSLKKNNIKHKQIAKKIVQKHGSRKSGLFKNSNKRKTINT